MRTCGASGCSKRNRPGGLHQPAPGREGQLLFGGVPGDRGGGGDGTDGQQQRCHRNHLPAATAGAAYRTADGDLGQFDSPPGRQPGGPRRRNRRVGGRPQRLRVDFQHPHRALFLRRGRGKGEVDEALGDSFSGVLVSVPTPPTIITTAPNNAAGPTCCGTSTTSEPYTGAKMVDFSYKAPSIHS